MNWNFLFNMENNREFWNFRWYNSRTHSKLYKRTKKNREKWKKNKKIIDSVDFKILRILNSTYVSNCQCSVKWNKVIYK